MSGRLFALILLAALCGCAKDREEKNTYLDSLWRAGYGYNNPNPQRQKDGLPPVNFDGSVHED